VSIKVLLADDHDIVRVGLRSLLGMEPDIEVIGEAANGRDAVGLAEELRANVVIMDIAMPGLNGIEATRQIARRAPNAKVIALCVDSGSVYVKQMLEAGAMGYLVKDSASRQLAPAVRAVAAGRFYLDDSVAGAVVKGFVEHVRQQQAGRRAAGSVPTPREREVLQLLGEGKSTRDIASSLGVSSTTIRTHRQRIMKKLGIRTTAGLIRYAIQERLTSLRL